MPTLGETRVNSELSVDVINDAVESTESTYSSNKIVSVIAENAMRGVAVFVSATEPTDKEINDIWIQI